MKYKYKKPVILSLIITVLIGGVCLIMFQTGGRKEQAENTYDNIQETGDKETGDLMSDDVQNIEKTEETEVNINIKDYYITNTGDPSNLYYIDENRVLWGCGRNNCGQLGQGTQDYDFHGDMVQIAEDVIHVDFSQSDFTIYLTADHKLYGMGNAGCGALQQYEEFDAWQYTARDHYTVTTPVLLMEDVVYARCGRSDVACLLSDGSIWIWGAIGFIYDGWNYIELHYEQKPVKVLENAVMVTGGLYNHAALLRDGSVWTWGYNYSGNCGVADQDIVPRPQKVAEDVVMVWTASMDDNIDCQDITEFGGMYKEFFENTIIQKKDGSYWICGANVGDEEKIIKYYYEVMDYPLVCTYEFLPYDNKQ